MNLTTNDFRMSNRIIFILIVIGLFGLASCMGPLTDKDNGRTIELSEDSPFTVNLKCPNKKDYWKVMEYDKTVIKQLGDAIIKPVSEKRIFEFQFQAIADGSTKLLIAYFSKEEPSIVQQTFELKIICGTMGRIESE